MLQKLIERRQKGSEEGFTLIELMVVVLIIAILIAIAIPTFLGARGRAQQRAAQSNVRNAFTAEKTVFTDNDQYSSDATTALPGVEPSLNWVKDGTPSTVQKNEVHVSVGDANGATNTQVVLGAKSDQGTCYYLRDTGTGPAAVEYGKDSACGSTTQSLLGAGAPAGGWAASW